jgi:hypothetical protein
MRWVGETRARFPAARTFGQWTVFHPRQAPFVKPHGASESLPRAMDALMHHHQHTEGDDRQRNQPERGRQDKAQAEQPDDGAE